MVRTERDTLGEVSVPSDALYGAQTQRAVKNYPISGLREHPTFIRAFLLIKRSAALANRELGALDERLAGAIVASCDRILGDFARFRPHFVVDVFQAGAGTSFNMNVNEVLANLANVSLGGRLGEYQPVHPNDHVNMAQSTNDVFPTAIRVAGVLLLGKLLPEQVDFLSSLYWPVALLLSVLSLTSLYHISAPVRTPWRRDLPGALLTITIWFLGSYVVRWVIEVSVGGTSIYGPLAAPIVLMIWLYVLSIAVLIGAALNAAVEAMWPRREVAEAQAQARAERVRGPDGRRRMKRPGLETGEIDLPPNRPPADNPLAHQGDQR